MRENSSVVLVADGLTPDTLDRAIREGDVPELAALAAAFGQSVITTVFPSVTGVAYIPMLTGFHPADAGVPGLRWFDRSRRLPAWLGHSRSYVGTQIRSIDRDLSPGLGGVLWSELHPCAPPGATVQGYMLGLGGGDIRAQHVLNVIDDVRARDAATTPEIVEVAG